MSTGSPDSGAGGPRRDLDDALSALAGLPAVVVAADFDGTLAPLVTDPMSARAVPGAVEALEEASTLPGVTAALVSGRDLETLRALARLVDGSDVVLVGSHGAHSSRAAGDGLSADAGRLLARLADELNDLAEAHPGSRVEHKPTAVALHTRGLDDARAAAALAAARELGDRHTGVHVLPGKEVVELAVVAADKGSAILRLASDVGATAAAYFGDDVTDERAFEALTSPGHVTVKVGQGETAAAYRVHGPEDVVGALRTFVRLRRDPSGQA